MLDALWDDADDLSAGHCAAAEPSRSRAMRPSPVCAATGHRFSAAAILTQALSAQSDYFTVTVTPADGPSEAFEALCEGPTSPRKSVYVKRVSKEVAP